MKASRAALPLVASLVTALAGAARAEDKPVVIDKVVAVADGTTIFRSDVVARAKQLVDSIPDIAARPEALEKLYKDVLERMIEATLIAEDAERLKIEVTDAEIEKAIETIAAQNKISRAVLEAEVKKSGLSMGDYRDELRQQLLQAKWTNLKIRNRSNLPSEDLPPAERERALIKFIETEHKRVVSELRAKSHVEVRW